MSHVFLLKSCLDASKNISIINAKVDLLIKNLSGFLELKLEKIKENYFEASTNNLSISTFFSLY